MKVNINEIKINARIRSENTDVLKLKESIQKVGLLNPIIINEEKELLSGFRRLTAIRELGYETIDAIIVKTDADKIKKLDIEYHENIGRCDLTEEDKINYEQIRDLLLNPPPKKNLFWILTLIWRAIISIFKRNRKWYKTVNSSLKF